MVDQYEGEDCIAVGSKGTLLSLMDKEMEILQARRSCSVSPNHMNYKESPSIYKDPNYSTVYASYTIFGSPLLSPPSTSLVSSLWSDLKGLLRSPTSFISNPHAHSSPPLLHHHNALFFKEHLPFHEHCHALCSKSPPPPSPPRTHFPKQVMAPHPHSPPPPSNPSSLVIFPHAQSAAALSSCPSPTLDPKQKVAAEKASSFPNKRFSSQDDRYWTKKADSPLWKAPLLDTIGSKETLAAGAVLDYPIRKSLSRNYHSQHERSDMAVANGEDRYDYQVSPTGIHQQSRKGNQAVKERSLAGAGSAKHQPADAKGRIEDAGSPHLQSPTYPKAIAMDAVYAMRRSIVRDEQSQNGKAPLLREVKAKDGARVSKKREEVAAVRWGKKEDEADNFRHNRGGRGDVQNEKACREKRGERESTQQEYSGRQRREESVCNMQEYYESCMQRRMEKGPCSTPRRSFARVSVVDLQCCHIADPSSTAHSFTRLSHS